MCKKVVQIAQQHQKSMFNLHKPIELKVFPTLSLTLSYYGSQAGLCYVVARNNFKLLLLYPLFKRKWTQKRANKKATILHLYIKQK